MRTSAEIIELLIGKSGNDINCHGAEGRTALSVAAENQQVDIIDKLLQKGADIDCQDLDNATPLLWILQSPRRFRHFGNVVISGDVEVYLGYDVNIFERSGKQDRVKETQAALTSHQIATALRLIGARVDAVDTCGRTALSLAVESGTLRLLTP